MKFSVIIPTYYRNEMLTRAVEGVIAQTYSNYEIIIIDDSKDQHAAETVTGFKARFADKADEIHYLSSGGIKQGGARNLGFKHSTGDLIAILDDDDLWVENKLQEEYNVLKEHNFGVVVYGGRTLHDEEGNKTSQYLPKYEQLAPHMIKLFNFVAFPALAFHRSVFDEVGYLDENLSTHEDWDFLNRLALKYKFIPIKKVLAKIFRHPNNRDKEHFAVWEKDKLEVQARYKKHWTALTYLLYFMRQFKLKLQGRKY